MRRTLALRARLAVLSVALLLAACGGGGDGGGGTRTPPAAPAVLTITTQALPSASVGAPYAETTLEAEGVTGDAVWRVESGSLPDGMRLEEDGTVSGTPTTTGSFAFVARVDDAVAMDTRDLMLAVDVLDLTVSGGLTADDAWAGRHVTLAAAGFSGTVSFTAPDNESGGRFTTTNGGAGTATWLPGPTAGTGVTDTLVATDSDGKTVQVVFDVMPHPTEGYTASFGSTDVWYIDPNPKHGSHAYATDFHSALVSAGFRDPTSTDANGTEADRLAALLIRIEVMRHVCPMFLRNADGTAGANGLAISFPFEEPGSGYTKPSPADSLVGSPTRYSVMGFTHGSQSGVIGTAYLDGSTNRWHENDTTDGSFELGVFCNRIVPFVNSSYGNPLPDDPVDAGDVAALKALIYELPSPGGRYNTLRRQARGLAKALAATVAHEIGHSLGLRHTSPTESGSIMNPSAMIGPSSTHRFTDADVTRMQTALPGAGKSGTSSLVAKFTAPGARPVEVCRCRGRAVPVVTD